METFVEKSKEEELEEKISAAAVEILADEYVGPYTQEIIKKFAMNISDSFPTIPLELYNQSPFRKERSEKLAQQ